VRFSGVQQINANRRLMQGRNLADEPIKPLSRLEFFWPAFAVGVGLLGVVVWTLFLGWLLGRAVLAIF
jgi:hypothetical protein